MPAGGLDINEDEEDGPVSLLPLSLSWARLLHLLSAVSQTSSAASGPRLTVFPPLSRPPPPAQPPMCASPRALADGSMQLFREGTTLGREARGPHTRTHPTAPAAAQSSPDAQQLQ